jgi:hypothetical protein
MKAKEKLMTNKECKALLKAIEIIVDLSPTKEFAKQKIQEISNEIEKEPTDTDQG